jgi:hypothetical protein
VTDVRLLATGANLWLDRLYIRHVITGLTNFSPDLMSCWEACSLWLTAVTLQGDSNENVPFGSLAVGVGQLYAEGELRTTAASNSLF